MAQTRSALNIQPRKEKDLKNFSPLLFFIFSFIAIPTVVEAGPLDRLFFPQNGRLIIIFVDVSGSIPEEDWDLYRRNYQGMLSTLQPGDRVVLGKIFAETLTSFTPVINEEIPNRGSTRARRIITERAKEKLLEAFNSIKPDPKTRDPKANKTRVLDALNEAEQLIKADRTRKSQWLLILSDMLEDSDETRFEKEKLTPAKIKNIIKIRKARGSFPDLQGVRIFVAGARAKTSTKIFEGRRFWEEYFKEAGAAIEPGHYVRDGLRFEAEG